MGLGQLGGPSGPPALVFPQGAGPPPALDQSVPPLTLNDLRSLLLQGNRVSKLAKPILEKAGKQNGPQREAAMS